MPLLDADPIKISLKSTIPRIAGVGTASPAQSWTQAQVLDFVLTHFDIKESTKSLYKKTLSNPSIQKRHFALDRLEDVLEKDHAVINRRFERAASHLATAALTNALATANLRPDEIDFLITTTCTGYVCPGLSSFVVEKAGLRNNIHTADLTGMGCGAAIPALREAAHFVQSHAGASAAVISTEICSAAMFSNDAPDIVVSNTLFSDGSACVILSGDRGNNHPKIRDFSSLLIPEWRENLRFVVDSGYLKNVLGKDVPKQSAQAAARVVADLLEKNELGTSDISHWIVHPGGEKIINAIEGTLGLAPIDLEASREVLKNFGNMSSASVLFVLQKKLASQTSKTGEWGVMISFGAGFSAYAALVEF